MCYCMGRDGGDFSVVHFIVFSQSCYFMLISAGGGSQANAG